MKHSSVILLWDSKSFIILQGISRLKTPWWSFAVLSKTHYIDFFCASTINYKKITIDVYILIMNKKKVINRVEIFFSSGLVGLVSYAHPYTHLFINHNI